LFDGPLQELKRMLWRQGHIRFDLKGSEQGAALAALELPNIRFEKVDELTYRASFDRDDYTSGDVIRPVVSAVDVRDIYIEEESIEEIVRRIYTGGAVAELQKSR
jgi:ABC-type uncharacterized transport system ATPase subunit